MIKKTLYTKSTNRAVQTNKGKGRNHYKAAQLLYSISHAKKDVCRAVTNDYFW